jgi:hypothetical protein
MSVLKNSYGVSIAFAPRISPINFKNKLGGSSLERNDKQKATSVKKSNLEAMLEKPTVLEEQEPKTIKQRSMSPRTKAKIRKKVIAFARQCKKLSFVTLTFTNKVDDREGIAALGAFLDNVSKRSKDFQYIWVAEKQTKNELFQDNIHFHLITNKYWKIDRWWSYWLEVQKKRGIVPREESFKPSSAFDVKVINSENIKGVVNYVTKYVTKNTSEFGCMVWNCSRKISALYTDFYSDISFLDQLEKLQKGGQLGGNIKTFQQEHCSIHLIPLYKVTNRFYDRIDQKNRQVWNSLKKEGSNESK